MSFKQFSCNAVNYHFRTDCFRCHAPKEGGEGGASGYDNGGYSSYDQPASTDNAALDAPNWDSSATAGWGASESAAPAASNGGGWGEPAAPTPAPAQAAPVQAAPAASAASAGGWGAPAAETHTATSAPAAGGWGEAPANTNGAGW